MENTESGNNEQSEIFSTITDEPSNTGGSSKAGSIVVLICCLLSIFLGGWVSLIIAGAIYTPFRKQSNGWLIFLGAYIISNIVLFILVKRMF